MEKIITRFPPSPTGPFHVGNARTALFNYLFTKQNNGQMLFRMEDTDKERSKKEYEEDIIENLKWLGIELDYKNLHRQSERQNVYKKYLEKLIGEGKAYVSKETEGDRDEVIRFKNPNKKIKFDDLIRGKIEFDTTELKDFVIAKSVNEPVYHLAVVVDDYETGVTHVVRGEDGISNTPRQILIQEAINAPRPVYAHLPFILAPDRSKLSKRKHGESVSVSYYKNEGYLAEAMINFLALLGWNPGTEQEIFSMQELIEKFDIKKVQKAGAVFNVEKLNWMNREYIKKMPQEELEKILLNYIPASTDKNKLKKIVELEAERISKFSDIKEGIGYLFDINDYDPKDLVWKNSSAQKTSEYLNELVKILCDIVESDWTAEGIKTTVMPYAEQNGRGEVLWPLRMALTGLERSPDPFIIAYILGKDETINRLKNARSKLSVI